MRAIFAGTFDPFTLGHRDIVLRAAELFDGVTVAVACECGKRAVSAKIRADIALRSVSDINGVDVEIFDGLLTDYVKGKNAVLVRGIRNPADLEYEKELCEIYKRFSNVKTVYFLSSTEVSHISSSTVRRLAALGADLSSFVAEDAAASILEIYGNKE